jgi:hypothetical protein
MSESTISLGPDPGANRFLAYALRGPLSHKLSHSESSENYALKIYAQCMNFQFYREVKEAAMHWNRGVVPR